MYHSFQSDRAKLGLSEVNLDTKIIFSERNLKSVTPNNILSSGLFF